MNSRLLQSEGIESARQIDVGLTSVEALDLVRKAHFGHGASIVSVPFSLMPSTADVSAVTVLIRVGRKA